MLPLPLRSVAHACLGRRGARAALLLALLALLLFRGPMSATAARGSLHFESAGLGHVLPLRHLCCLRSLCAGLGFEEGRVPDCPGAVREGKDERHRGLLWLATLSHSSMKR